MTSVYAVEFLLHCHSCLDWYQKFNELKLEIVHEQKFLSYELDVKVGIMEAKYHRESQLQDRKMLAEQMKELKESLDDEGPPAKVSLSILCKIA